MKVLFFKLGGIGDAVDSAVICGGLRKKHPEATITAVVRDATHVSLFRSIHSIKDKKPVADIVLSAPRQRIKTLFGQRHAALDWKTAWDDVTRNADWDFAYDARPYIGRVYSFEGGIPSIKIALNQEDTVTYDNPCSRWTHKLAEREKTTIELLSESMGVDAAWEDVRLNVPDIDIPGETVVLCNAADGSRRCTKQWAFSRFSQVAAWLKAKGFYPIQLGIKQDKLIRHCVDMRGKTSVVEAASIIAKARLMVSVEGGLARLAALARTPSVVIFTSTPHTLFAVPHSFLVIPKGCPIKNGCFWRTGEWMMDCQLQTHVNINGERLPLCAAYITVAEVIERMEEALDEMS